MPKKIDALIIFIWLYLVIALPPLTILYLAMVFSPESNLFGDFIVKTPDFPALVATAIILPLIGAVLSLGRKKMKIVFFWKLEKQSKIHMIVISLLLSFIFWQFYFVLSFLSYLGLIILIIFFLLVLPSIDKYLRSVNFDMVKTYIIPARSKNRKDIVKKILFSLIILFLIHMSVMILDTKINEYNHTQQFIMRHPQIKTIKPGIAYYDTKVVLLGKGFGWKGKIDTDTKFKYQDGKIDISLWTDTKVIFTIPLHWKTGDIMIWIQKPTEWDGKKIMVDSNQVKIRLISRDDGWDKDDDAYFEQLKHLDKETLKINGYK